MVVPATPQKYVRHLMLSFDFPQVCGKQVQKAFNEVYRSFNVNQSPFVAADFILPKGTYQGLSSLADLSRVTPLDSCDINVSPDKRTILLHSEGNLVRALKVYSLLSSADQATSHLFTSGRLHWKTLSPPRARRSASMRQAVHHPDHSPRPHPHHRNPTNAPKPARHLRTREQWK